MKKVAIHAICVNSETNPNIKDFEAILFALHGAKHEFLLQVSKIFDVKY